MGSFASKLTKPFKNWNVESRAHKVISQSKPKPAPTFASTKKQIELVDKLDPTYKKLSKIKDAQLDEYLKKVYVSSSGSEMEQLGSRSNPERPLPKDKFLPEAFEYGFYEPEKVQPGKVSLRKALEMMDKHSQDKNKYTAAELAKEYKLDEKVTENILEFFKLYQVLNIELDAGNEDVVARTIPISTRSGLMINAEKTVKKKEYDDDYTDFKKKQIDKIKKN